MKPRRKEQRSVALPPEYWAEIDALAHAQRERPAVYAANLIRGALENIRARAPDVRVTRARQGGLFDDDGQGNQGGLGHGGG